MGFRLSSGELGGHLGMLVVETIAKIRRAYFGQLALQKQSLTAN